jgi:uncharacterized membrane protein (DUF373 family)
MTEELQTNTQSSKTSKVDMKSRTLQFYGRVLDVIVTALVFVMVLILIGAVVGLILDFIEAASKFGSAVTSHNIVHGIVDSIDRELVIDVLSVFVLIELFRTFTDYLEFRRVRLRVLSEVGIAFVLREVFIGLYDHSMNWTEIITLSVLLAVLVAARTAAVQFHPQDNSSD